MNPVDVTVDPDLQPFIQSEDPLTQLSALQVQTLREIQRLAATPRPEAPQPIPFRVNTPGGPPSLGSR